MSQEQARQLHQAKNAEDTLTESLAAIRQIAQNGLGLQRLAEKMGVSEEELVRRKQEVAEAQQARLVADGDDNAQNRQRSGNGQNGQRTGRFGLGPRARERFRIRRNQS